MRGIGAKGHLGRFSRTMSKSLKLNPDLWRRVVDHAQKAGYSSAEEFVEHVLEKELSSHEDAQDSAEIERRLKGLGYLE